MEERKLPVEHLERGVKTKIDKGANLKWKIEHAGCPINFTHVKSPEGEIITLFWCERHPFADVLVVKGKKERIPE